MVRVIWNTTCIMLKSIGTFLVGTDSLGVALIALTASFELTMPK